MTNMTNDSEVEARITQALEAAPTVHIPADFAARVAARVPDLAWDVRTPRVGIWTVRVALALLAIAMFVFAPQALSYRAVPLTVELLLTAEFVALTAWAGLNPRFIR